MKTFLLLAACVGPVLAASQPRTCTGRVEGPAGEPAAYATAVLLRDGMQAAGATTDSLGVFVLNAAAGTYTLRISHLACRPLEQFVTVPDTGGPLGTFRLQASANTLEAVVVESSAIMRRADRFVVTVGDTPALAGRDAAELVARAPGVWLDDTGVSINGMKGAKIFVGDRELKLDGDHLQAYLRNLTATEIARIEVIPQAGAEYAADARGGVVRIVLRRRSTDGMNGSLVLAVTQGVHLADYAPVGNIAVHAGKWTLSAAASGRFTPRSELNFDESRTYPGDAVRFAGRSELDGRSNTGTGRLGAFCDIAPRHSIGMEAEYVSENERTPSTALTRIIQHEHASSAASRYRQHGSGNTLSALFNYRWQTDTLGSSLRLLFDWTRRRTAGDNRYRTLFSAAGMQRDTAYRSTTASRYDIFSAEAAAEQRLPHAMTLQAGLKYTRNRLGDDALYEGRTPREWVPQAAYSYALGYTEQIAAAYASLAAEVGRWSLSAGLRAEYTATDSRSNAVHGSYFGLFPHASATWGIDRLRTWMLALQYARNIERPGFRQLNPARIQLSDYNYTAGNPALRPTYIHRVSLTLIWKYRYTLTVGGNLHRDLIREVCRTDPDAPDVSGIMPENHRTENHWFAALNAPLRLSRCWSLTLNVVGVRQSLRMSASDPLAGHWLAFANAVTGIDLPAGFRIELIYSAHSRLYSGNSEVEARHTLGASVRKRFCRDRLVLSLAGHNLAASREAYVSRIDGLVRRMEGRTPRSSRYWKATLTWNFRSGRTFKAPRAESAAAGERRRMAKNYGQTE